MSQTTFKYRALDRRGVRTRGVVSAADRTDAYRQLVAGGVRPLSIRSGWSGPLGPRQKKITPKDLSHLTYQLSVLMQARISIVDGLRSIAEQEPNPRLRGVMEDIAGRINAGSTVTDALRAHRRLFGDVYVETVRAAEISGNMIEVLGKLAEMLDTTYQMNRSIRGALVYPACVVGALALALAFLLIFVVPRFSSMFESRGVELPAPTKLLLGLSDFIRLYWYALIAGGGAGAFVLMRAWAEPRWRRRIDSWLHAVPFLRVILQGVAVSRFAHVFGLTLRSGLSLIEALEVSGRASGRPLLESDTRKMQEQVEHGGRLSDVMMRCSYLPAFARRLLTAGEESAELSKMCEIVARHYDREVSHLAKNISTVIEPIMIVGLAGIVLIVALAIFLPMWNMAALIG